MAISDTFSALGDPARLRTLVLLKEMELTVSELVDVLGLAQSTVSGMLRVMMSADLVRGRKDGRRTYYTAADGADWVDVALSDVPLTDADADALDRVRSARLADAGGDPVTGAFDHGYVPGRSWKTLARSLLMLSRFGTVADIGVGRGDLTLLLARSSDALLAVDTDADKLTSVGERAAKAGLENVRTWHGPVGSLRETVDLVAFSLSLHCHVDPAAAVADAFDVVRPGGRIWITELAAHQHEWVRARCGHHHLGFDRDALGRMLAEAGFVDIEVRAGGRDRRQPPFHTLIAIATRPKGAP